MCEVPSLYCPDELVADMVVDPDVTHTKSKHSQRVLVIVGQSAVAGCAKGGKGIRETKIYSNMTSQ